MYDQLFQHPIGRYVWIGFEAGMGMWLVSGIRGRASAVTLLILLSIFSGLIVAEMTREFPKPCGCMGAEFVAMHDPAAIRRSLALSLTRNAAMMSGAAWLFLGAGRSRKQNLQPLPEKWNNKRNQQCRMVKFGNSPVAGSSDSSAWWM